MNTRYDLQRFIDAQTGMYEQVRAELAQGRKTTHWMWFIFPQIKGLGQSPMAIRYAIASLEEAKTYLQNPVLGPRLRECCELLLHVEGQSISEIMGYPDDLKLRSSMTLFSRAASDNSPLNEVLTKYFNGEPDAVTLKLLKL